LGLLGLLIVKHLHKLNEERLLRSIPLLIAQVPAPHFFVTQKLRILTFILVQLIMYRYNHQF
jgi:hypothetical protein